MILKKNCRQTCKRILNFSITLKGKVFNFFEVKFRFCILFSCIYHKKKCVSYLYFFKCICSKNFSRILQKEKSFFWSVNLSISVWMTHWSSKKVQNWSTLLHSCKLLTVPAAGIYIICAQTTLIMHSNLACTADRVNTLGYPCLQHSWAYIKSIISPV